MAEETSYGERAVGLTFNPSGKSVVDEIKTAYARIIDTLDMERGSLGRGEGARVASIAITEAQTACMWAVKALTWKDPA